VRVASWVIAWHLVVGCEMRVDCQSARSSLPKYVAFTYSFIDIVYIILYK